MRRTFAAAFIAGTVIAVVYAIAFWTIGFYGLPDLRWADAGQTVGGLIVAIALVALAVMVDNKIARGTAVVLALIVGSWVFSTVWTNGGSIWTLLAVLFALLLVPFAALVVASVAQLERTRLATAPAPAPTTTTP